MARLLSDWFQYHPAIARVSAHVQFAGPNAGDNNTLARPYMPDPDIDLDALNARLAAAPAKSMDEVHAHVCALIAQQTGFQCSAQTPPPAPPAPPEPPATQTTTTSTAATS